MNGQSESIGKQLPGDVPMAILSSDAAPQRLKLDIATEDVPTGAAIRDELGWGKSYFPPIQRHDGKREFRRICDGVLDELREIGQYIENGRITEVGAGCIAEIKALVQQLYECEWGEDDCLKNIAVGIQFQVNNVEFTENHIHFLNDIMLLLRARDLIDPLLVDMCYDMIEEHGLDNFRGTVTEPDVVKVFKIVEVQPVNDD